MKTRILAFLLSLLLIVSLFAGSIPSLAANNNITVKFHYYRPDGNYTDWEVWFWDNSSDDSLESPYPLIKENGEMVATVKVSPGTVQLGYIVRQPDWTKDVAHDQFINLTGIQAGTVHFYVESGVPTQTSSSEFPAQDAQIYAGHLKLDADVVLGQVITNNRYDIADANGDPRIVLSLSSELDYDADVDTFTIFNSDGNVEIKLIKKIGTLYYLYPTEKLDMRKAYFISFEGQNYKLNMPDYYSSEDFEAEFTYTGNDLGATYTKDCTYLRLWAPLAVNVQVWLYSNGNPAVQEYPVAKIDMTPDVNGTWIATLEGNCAGTYYTYYVDNYTEQRECVDPYARTTGVNGYRSMIIDLDSTDPEGWADDRDPHYDDAITDAIIWEIHIRDFSCDASSGIRNKGKYLGMIETGTTNSYGQSTGLDYLKNLGITHIQLLPVYDFGSVNEATLDSHPDQFNWGYDPMNYNVPEGSYSSNPYDGEVRVKEFKQMVKGLHDNGISVIMDVAYGHVYDVNKFSINAIVPNYFSRPNSNGSGCGNDTASERLMVRKYIVDSVSYWADEYHIDGFRFELAGLMDVDTINAIIYEVRKTHPNVIFYGEGWQTATKPTKTVTLATSNYSTRMLQFAFFNENIRNALRGSTFTGASPGYISGNYVSDSEMLACFRGMPAWCTSPTQSINYLSCHDNLTLFDHISITQKYDTPSQRAASNKLGAAFYFTAQGIPFLQAGEEFLRSKPDDGESRGSTYEGYFSNSYAASDAVNSLKWDSLNGRAESSTMEYYKGLIAFRKAHPALRMASASLVNMNVSALSNLQSNVFGYQIKGGKNGEPAEAIIAIFNANETSTSVTLPDGLWHIYVDKESAGTTSLGYVSGSVTVDGVSAMILAKGMPDNCDHLAHGIDGVCVNCGKDVAHTYDENGLCDCGSEQEGSRTIYFTAAEGWTEVWYRCGTKDETKYLPMTQIETNLYSCHIPASAVSITFYNGVADYCTTAVPSASSGMSLFDYAKTLWLPYPPQSDVPEEDPSEPSTEDPDEKPSNQHGKDEEDTPHSETIFDYFDPVDLTTIIVVVVLAAAGVIIVILLLNKRKN